MSCSILISIEPIGHFTTWVLCSLIDTSGARCVAADDVALGTEAIHEQGLLCNREIMMLTPAPLAAGSLLLFSLLAAAAAATELPRADPTGSSCNSDDVLVEPKACQPKLLGSNLDAPAHDLLQTAAPKTSTACAAACCANPKCAGALFEPLSAVKFGGCDVGKPCCFMKTSVADSRPNPKPVKGGADLWEIPGRSQDDEKLSFLSATLGSHMVLQRAPQQAVVWGFTAPGSTVATTMTPAGACNAKITGACRATTFHTIADTKGTWRQKLPATPASKMPYNFSFTSSSPQKESAAIADVLFGDVFLCGGQVRLQLRPLLLPL